ncbi:endonuclease [Pyrococcus furiosus DSM 3638]|uniref:Endonuclease n=3 Tax=Pyrococcus furiosus TaxID=2261 RepID=A0A5C0XRQ3_PYRFU|nr:thermonuclease family protein [Pyrococcus furiosus]AAL81422.1 putative endonuclease [Pyrococcus furiosus DSM 3638]AFN04082.1 endonuclease [Pyrococcus furiosus COM1]QEK78938.1 endonuclease [Pyrococcus furiosus DSM 3638]
MRAKIAVVLILFLFFSGCTSRENELRGKVVGVVDGDTVYVELESGGKVKVRLVGIDAPELEEEIMRPGEYGNITNTSCLLKYGKIAKDYLRNLTLGKEVVLIMDRYQGERDKYGRLLAYLYLDSTDVNELMVEKGLARVFYEKKFEKMKEYLKKEEIARENRYGLWSCS